VSVKLALISGVRTTAVVGSTVLVVGESAIFTREDALLLQEAGVKAMLVGESLLRQENLASAVTELIGC